MLYHFTLEVSDIDRGVYETLDFRVAQHPSETAPYLLTRVLAYALSFQEGLEFSPEGLHDPEIPALRAMDHRGGVALWIEIGNPSARKLHKASKAAGSVVVYTYKKAEVLLEEIRAGQVHRAEEIQVIAFEAKFLAILEAELEKNNRWSILRQQGQLSVSAKAASAETELTVQHV